MVFFTGGWFTYSSVALIDIFGIDQVAKSYGIMQIAHSSAYLASSALHGQFTNIRVFLYFLIFCQILAEFCQHWHSMVATHCMSMLAGFCQDLAENYEI